MVRGKSGPFIKAIQILDDPEREFVSSLFLKLEVVPQAVHNKKEDEIKFYEDFFSSVVDWAEISESLVADAIKNASDFGLKAMDALHIAAALSLKADEFITTEKTTTPIHRVKSIKVLSIRGQ